MSRARIIEMAKEADPEWLLPHPDVCADEVAALERFAALVLAQAGEMTEQPGDGHSATSGLTGSYGATALLESAAKLLERCGPHLQGVERECCGCPRWTGPEEPPECCGQAMDLSDHVANEVRCIREAL